MLGKRLRERHYIIAEATVKSVGAGEGGEEYGQTVNINSSGVAVYLKRHLDTGTHVNISIEIFDDGETIKAGPLPATVMWEMAVGDHRTTGFKFDGETSGELLHFMKIHLEKRVLKF